MTEDLSRSFVPVTSAARVDIDTSVPHIARIYDFWLGGKDNFAADRKVAKEVLEIYPDVVTGVRTNRAFLARAVRYLAGEGGIRQFLDIGTGLPSADNTHEVAQSAAPGSRVVYVDNDPIVLMHARALLTGNSQDGATAYLDADVRDPAAIVAGAAELLDFSRPVAVIMLAVLHVVSDDDNPHQIVSRLMAAVPPGSFLVISHGASDIESRRMSKMAGQLNQSMPTGQKPAFRDHAEVTRFFDGLDLLDPGVVRVPEWRPASEADAQASTVMWCGVGRKP